MRIKRSLSLVISRGMVFIVVMWFFFVVSILDTEIKCRSNKKRILRVILVSTVIYGFIAFLWLYA